MEDFAKNLIQDWFDTMIDDDGFWQMANWSDSFRRSVKSSVPYVTQAPSMGFSVTLPPCSDVDPDWMSTHIGDNGVDWTYRGTKTGPNFYFAKEDAAVLFKLTWL